MTATNTIEIEASYSYRDLEAKGEGSRWTIDRKVRAGEYPKPDYYQGASPRWLASTINAHRARLIEAARDRGNGAG